MSNQSDQKERVRAWVLIQAKPGSVPGIADEIRATIDKGADDLVVIRADEVEIRGGDSDVNLVVPIDAKDGAVLEKAVLDIKNITGEKAEVEVFEVSDHHPKIPHTAEGFITDNELTQAPGVAGRIIEVGRQKHSPGHNPWG